MPPIRLLILAGGQSDEHEVSLVSAGSVLQALDGHPRIRAQVVVVTRQGAWLSPAASRQAVHQGPAALGGGAPLSGLQIGGNWDLVMPLIHGPFGEDGTLQGMLEMGGVAYVGAGVLASALCMDKAMTKRVLAQAGIPQVPHRLFTAHAIGRDLAAQVAVCQQVPAPWFVKPNNLGSSVGIAKVKHAKGLAAALAHAAGFGRRVIVESAVPGARELEVAVLGNAEPQASVVGEITYQSEFYDYETKYTAGRAQLHLPAQVPASVAEEVRRLGCEAFVHTDCAGLARVDFLLGDDGRLWLNELNTLPGFTPLSMYPKLWEHSGLAYPDLIERLCALALERHPQASGGKPQVQASRP